MVNQLRPDHLNFFVKPVAVIASILALTVCAGLGVMIAAPRLVHVACTIRDRESRFRLHRVGVVNTRAVATFAGTWDNSNVVDEEALFRFEIRGGAAKIRPSDPFGDVDTATVIQTTPGSL